MPSCKRNEQEEQTLHAIACLHENAPVKLLNLRHYSVNDPDKFLESLRKNVTLQRLWVCCECVGVQRMQQLVVCLPQSLKMLDLDFGSIEDEDTLTHVVSQLKLPKTLQELCLRFPKQHGNKCAMVVAHYVLPSYGQSLEKIDMRENRIKNEGATALMRSLGRGVKSLDLSHNLIADDGVCHISNEIRQLKSLNLSFNRFGDTGAEALACMLQRNRTLTRLYLGGNPYIGRAAVKSILASIEHNDIVTKVVMSRSLFYLEDWSKMQYFLSSNLGGRRILRERNVPVGLWSILLARASKDPSMLQFFLTRSPNLVQR